MDKIKLRGNHYEMGKQMGEFFIKNNRNFPIKLNKNLLEHGKKCLNILEYYYPEVIDEIRGITNAINHDFYEFGAWLTCMGSSLPIREGHNVEIRGCTAFSFIYKDKIYYGRDNDLPPYLKEVSKTIDYAPKGKNRFHLNSSSFINGEEGINEHGLVCAMTFVLTPKEYIKPGFSSLFIVRYILENCTNLNEAIKIIKKIPIASSCNILLADKNNNMIIAECSCEKINIRKPQKNSVGDHFIVTVNHFTTKEMQKYDKSKQNIYKSTDRYVTANNALYEFPDISPVNYTKDILSGKYGFMCQYKRVKFETIWSTIFDIDNNFMYLSKGNPMVIPYDKINLFK